MKIQWTKYALLFGIMAFFTTLSFGQTASGWTLLKDSAGVKVSYQIQNCSGADWVLLKLENQSASGVTVSWDDELKAGATTLYNTENFNASFLRAITIGANETKNSSCSNINTGSRLTIPLTMILAGNSVNSISYQIKNLSVTTN